MKREKLKTEVRQEQIVRAAMNLIASRGLKGLSMAALANRIGLVPSAIYRHFKSKDDIVDMILGVIRERLLTNIRITCKETSLLSFFYNLVGMLTARFIVYYSFIVKIKIIQAYIWCSKILWER